MSFFLFAATLVLAQNADDCPSIGQFEICQTAAKDYLSQTCAPLQAKNMSWYQQCLCYQAQAAKQCYDLCPDSKEAKATGTALLTSVNSYCAAANINPATPRPAKAPWDTTPTTTSIAAISSSVAAKTTATGSAPAATGKSNNALPAATADVLVSGLFALFFAL